MGKVCSKNGEKKNEYRTLVGKPEGNMLLGRTRRRCVKNMRIYLGGIRWGRVAWIGLAEDRDQWKVILNLWVTCKYRDILELLRNWRLLNK
jgi:hypothetical protein